MYGVIAAVFGYVCFVYVYVCVCMTTCTIHIQYQHPTRPKSTTPCTIKYCN